MIIYKDIFTGDELLSDTYPLEVIHDCVYKVKGKMEKKDCNIDESKIGGNKSAEGGDDEGVEDTSVQVINLVDAHQLQECPFGSKKDWKDHIKEYMKRLVDKLKESQIDDDTLKKIQKNLGSFVKEVLEEFKEYTFYLGEKFNVEGMFVLMKWEEGETVPCFYFFKHGLEEEKV